jgi:Tol biopolymer transport system component
MQEKSLIRGLSLRFLVLIFSALAQFGCTRETAGIVTLGLLTPVYAARDAGREWRRGCEQYGAVSAQFSPDGEYLLVAWRERRHQCLYRVAVDGSSCSRLTRKRGFHFDPVYSEDGRCIAFVHSKYGKRVYSFLRGSVNHDKFNKRGVRVCVMNADGTGLRTLAEGIPGATSPQFSPDGTQVAFAAWHSAREADILVVPVEGEHEPKPVTSEEGIEVMPAFLPDGRRVAFIQTAGGSFMPFYGPLWRWWVPCIARIDGGEIRQLRRLPPEETRPYRDPNSLCSYSLSPNGEYLLITAMGGDDCVRLVSTAPSVTERFVRPKGAPYKLPEKSWEPPTFLHYAHFSPDGRSIVFALERGHAPTRAIPNELHIMDLGSWQARQVTDLGLQIANPAFSPDGRRLAFVATPKPQKLVRRYELWIVNADGTNPHRIPVDSG